MSDLTVHTPESHNLSYFPLPTFSCHCRSAARPGGPDFCLDPADESSGLRSRMRWLALDAVPEDDVRYSLRRLVTARPPSRSQGRRTAAERSLRRSFPEAQRAWRWLSLAPEEQAGRCCSKRRWNNWGDFILQLISRRTSLISLDTSSLIIQLFLFDICFVCATPMYSQGDWIQICIFPSLHSSVVSSLWVGSLFCLLSVWPAQYDGVACLGFGGFVCEEKQEKQRERIYTQFND